MDSKRLIYKNLDDRARAVYDFVREAVSTKGYPPSLREIGAGVGLTSPSSVKHQMDKLERLGLLRRDPNRPRAIEVVALDTGHDTSEHAIGNVVHMHAGQTETVSIPLVGQIAAGSPILAQEHLEEYYEIPRALTGSGDLFMLKVQGDSMIDAAICDGDWVVVRAQPDANNGDIVAALLNLDEGPTATVKVLSRRDGHQWLLPRNNAYAPIDGDQAMIMGKVVTVLRSL